MTVNTRFISTRYALNTAALAAAVFLLVASRVFDGNTLEWLGFGVSAGILLAAVAGLVTGTRSRHLLGYGVLGVTAAWSAVAALVFTGSTLGWLVFADAVALAAIALGASVVHEVTTERVVHTLHVGETVRTGEHPVPAGR